MEFGIQARMRNGVLEVELPKREHVMPRKIEVQMGLTRGIGAAPEPPFSWLP
jgi:hypothetical protein